MRLGLYLVSFWFFFTKTRWWWCSGRLSGHTFTVQSFQLHGIVIIALSVIKNLISISCTFILIHPPCPPVFVRLVSFSPVSPSNKEWDKYKVISLRKYVDVWAQKIIAVPCIHYRSLNMGINDALQAFWNHINISIWDAPHVSVLVTQKKEAKGAAHAAKHHLSRGLITLLNKTTWITVSANSSS